MNRRLLCLGGLVWFCLPINRVPAETSHPLVPGFERFHADSNQASGGELLLGELGCVACHANQVLPVELKKAPRLGSVGSRVLPDYLRKFIAAPQETKPGTTMPDMFGGVDEKTRAEQVESLVHYLVAQSDGDLPQVQLPQVQLPTGGSRVRGAAVFHRVGCVACHGARQEGAKTLPYAVPLDNLNAKYTLPSLAQYLRDPLHVRPAGRMPDMNLGPADAQAIAGYLLDELPELPGIQMTLYHGDWGQLPDFSTMNPVSSTSVQEFSANHGGRRSHFAVVYQGKLAIEYPGEYRFFSFSDDGSVVKIDGQIVVDNDGVHGGTEKSGTIQLAAKSYEVVIEFFEREGEEVIRVEYEGPHTERQDLAPALIRSSPPSDLPTIEFEIDPARVAKGRRLFASMGCAKCHQLEDDQRGPGGFKAPDLSTIHHSKNGCLAGTGGTPRYRLSRSQRAALSTALERQISQRAPKVDVVASTLERFNCYACHARDFRGGISRVIDEYFRTTQKEMGDEGRIPPPLDGVGDKLTAGWLAHILADGAEDRPYMFTKMPKFGADNVGHLTDAFFNADHQPPLAPVVLDRKTARDAGWKMVGEKAFGCIKCHTFGRFAATGVQSIDMTVMTKRLRSEWFRRYVRNPPAYRPGTRMPSAWPLTGPSLLADPLDGDTEKQIVAVWTYLEDGLRARVPEGLGKNTMELIPTSEAIIYRNFIQGAGSRAIAVGYPEAIHLAFDANELRLALIWQGGFLDASMHWKGRGQGFQTPLGDKVQRLAPGVAFAVLASPGQSWPRQSARDVDDYKFLGYRVTKDQRPTFRYQIGAAVIEDFPNPIEDGIQATLVRQIKVIAGNRPLWFRAAVGNIIEQGDWYRVGDLRIRVDGAATLIRDQAGQQELLVKLPAGRVTEFVEEFAW